jgi:UDP-N-acetylmuramoyl-tripeptide--D-alanyl-D-alanine ligase
MESVALTLWVTPPAPTTSILATTGGHGLRAAVVAACVVATIVAGARWLRVAQREHYLFDAASRFALRWWTGRAVNAAGLLVAVAGLVLAWRWVGTAFATAAAVTLGPLGLAVRGRTSPLVWTRRLRTLAGVWAGFQAGAIVGGVLSGAGPVVAAAAALAVPVVVDLACAVTAPFERRLADTFVARAATRLRRVGPTVVAITGSYGKTTTKGYVAHLVSGTRSVVASPASFNNRAGLARAVNEHLADGTQVFVAEMGTYGRGEIAEMTSWIRPDIAAITAVGPVHLERFGSEERILEAKAEILEHAGRIVLLTDDPRLAALADVCAARGARVWRVSARHADADVSVKTEGDGLTVRAKGVVVGRGVTLDARPENLAVAVAVALELGVTHSDVARRLPTLPVAPHRLEATTSPSGAVVVDDTYNANPAGARVALATLARLGHPGRRRVVVTPGMVELGPLQPSENARFAREAAQVATHLVVVGHTNRRALLHGADEGADEAESEGAGQGTASDHADGAARGLQIVSVRTRQQATQWVRTNLGPGDAVLYENDLPDHYP